MTRGWQHRRTHAARKYRTISSVGTRVASKTQARMLLGAGALCIHSCSVLVTSSLGPTANTPITVTLNFMDCTVLGTAKMSRTNNFRSAGRYEAQLELGL